MKKMIYILLFFCLTTLTGCNQQSKDGGGLYAAIVIINGQEYNGAIKENEANKDLYNGIEIGEEIGTISKKVDMNIFPKEMQSNYYEPGTKIYSVKGTDEYIIMVDKDKTKYQLSKVKNQKKR